MNSWERKYSPLARAENLDLGDNLDDAESEDFLADDPDEGD